MLDRTHYEDAGADPGTQSYRSANGSLSVELARLDQCLAAYLSRLRQRGRSNLGDAVGGAVIEDGEAEGILGELYDAHKDGTVTGIVDRWDGPLCGLNRAQDVFALLPAERDMLLLATAVELDSRYGRLMAYLNDHVQMTRPTLGLAMSLFVPDADSSRATFIERTAYTGTIARLGLVRLEGDGPVNSRALRVPMSFWPRLVDMTTEPRFAVSTNPTRHDASISASPALASKIQNLVAGVADCSSDRKVINVCGDADSGHNDVASYVASRLRRTTLTVDANEHNIEHSVDEIAREAVWHQAAIVVRNADKLDELTHLRLLSLAASPLVYATDTLWDGEILERCDRTSFELRVPSPSTDARTSVWQSATSAAGIDVDSSALAARFAFGPERIRKAVKRASAQAALSHPVSATQEDVETICRRMQRTDFGGLAHKLPCPFTESDIVLPKKTSDELDLICTWARHGHRLFTNEGAGRNLRTGKGLVCLFSGPPGTGKTMAAQVIGRRLGFDVYRIDLSQVVNKYIGETEKNLARVFDEAQRSKVVLFFDEAETLYGDRTDVKTAQDRFANIEIGYLLQRIETFEGVAVLATNLQKNLDEAFLRRLSVVAEFPIPGADERFQIWEKLLPPVAERSSDVDVELLSRQFKIAGGDIRNSIFSALLLSADDGTELGMPHLVRGLWRELQKSGRIVDSAQFGQWRNCIAEEA